jgi:hypothetical protein
MKQYIGILGVEEDPYDPIGMSQELSEKQPPVRCTLLYRAEGSSSNSQQFIEALKLIHEA